MDVDELYIPQGIKTRTEYFEGFGKKELMYLIISVVITSGIAYLAYLTFLSLLKSILLVMIIPTAVVFLTVKTDMNISVLEEFLLLIRFHRSQKYYPYISLDEWEI